MEPKEAVETVEASDDRIHEAGDLVGMLTHIILHFGLASEQIAHYGVSDLMATNWCPPTSRS